MIKPKITIHQEEKLSEEVSKYSNPYDKKVMVGIKKVKKANTWRKVEESYGYGEHKSFFMMSSKIQRVITLEMHV